MSASLPAFIPFNTPDQKPVPWNEDTEKNTAAPEVVVHTPYKEPTKKSYTVLMILAIVVYLKYGKR